MHPLALLDQQFVWHPFTQMQEWLESEPIVIVRGKGARLRDVRGKWYLDANASIWTNLHGHQHPRITAAIRRQLGRIAHSSALGLANEPAAVLAKRLVGAAHLEAAGGDGPLRNPVLRRVFYSDDGSTALEVALKLAYEVSRRTGRSRRPRFLSLAGAYHGDTVGAVSVGHIDLFHRAYAGLLFKSDAVMAPYCYRCPYNRARPDRSDARDYRRCGWECLGKVEKAFERQKRRGEPYAAWVFEPLMQGAAGMVPQPEGWLQKTAAMARAHGALLVADEVMTGFGRTGSGPSAAARADASGSSATRNLQPATGSSLFACHREGVQPDFLCVAKGLTGGYLPMAATLTTDAVFGEFLGGYGEFKTFFHGHSYTGNQLGAAAALASLDVLESPASQRQRRRLERQLASRLKPLWTLPQIGDIRREGLVVGVELVKDWRTREPFGLEERAGIRVCAEMARQGVLTRAIGSVVVLMPPYVTTAAELDRMVGTLERAVRQVLR